MNKIMNLTPLCLSLKSADASYDSRYMCSLLLEPRSLLVLQDDMYTRYIPYQELMSTAWRAEGASNYAERHLNL